MRSGNKYGRMLCVMQPSQMRARTGSFSKLRASIRRSSAKLVQKLKGSPNGPGDADFGGGYVSASNTCNLYFILPDLSIYYLRASCAAQKLGVVFADVCS